MKTVIYPIPNSSKRNKYFDLLYGNMGKKAKEGFDLEVRSAGFAEVMKGISRAEGKEKIIVHIHWPTVLYGSKFLSKSLYLMAKNFWTLKWLKKHGCKIIWTMHNFYSHDYDHPVIDKIGSRILLKMADRVIVQQKNICEKLSRSNNGKKFSYIPHGNYINAYGPIFENREVAKRELGFVSDDIVVLSLGMIRPYKKIDEIIKTFNGAASLIDKRIKLLIAGNCEKNYCDYLKKLIGGNPNIILKDGFVADDQLPKYFAAGDYSVFHYDDSTLTSGAVILSLSYGVPSIIRNVPAAELIETGKNGFVFSSNEELKNILADLPKTEKISKERVIDSVRKFDWRDVSDKLEDIYKEIV